MLNFNKNMGTMRTVAEVSREVSILELYLLNFKHGHQVGFLA